MRQSLGQRLDALKGIGPGFDHLRIGLALSIFTWHAFTVSYGQDFGYRLNPVPIPLYLASLLPMFFGLSGFLVMGSALRTGEVKTFIVLRLLRIVPALFTEVIVSALILGPLLTTLTLPEYFSSPMFWEYLGSLIGRVRFTLPGVFADNPAPLFVNFALWTVGPEILCYVVMALLILTGIFRSARLMIAVTVAYALLTLAVGLLFGSVAPGDVLPTKMLILSFLCGNLVYLGRYLLPFSYPLAALSYVVGAALIYFGQAHGIELPLIASIPLLIYPVAVTGLAPLPPLPFFHRGDYSYGIYLFGFPIQQSVAHFLPAHREWWINLAISLPITLTLAVASWNHIEKPALALRRRFLAPASPGASAPEPATRHTTELSAVRPTMRPMGRLTAGRAAAITALAVYGIFVIDASRILPIRPGARMLLYGFGLYQHTKGTHPPRRVTAHAASWSTHSG